MAWASEVCECGLEPRHFRYERDDGASITREHCDLGNQGYQLKSTVLLRGPGGEELPESFRSIGDAMLAAAKAWPEDADGQ